MNNTDHDYSAYREVFVGLDPKTGEPKKLYIVSAMNEIDAELTVQKIDDGLVIEKSAIHEIETVLSENLLKLKMKVASWNL